MYELANAGVESEYKIVGSNEADPFENKISDRSAVGAALIGKRKGDVVHATTNIMFETFIFSFISSC